MMFVRRQLPILFALGFAQTALAAPDRVAEVIAEGSSLTALSASADGAWAAAVDEGSETVWFVDTRLWVVSEIAPCSAAAIDVAFWGEDGDRQAYVACDDGTLGLVELDDSAGSVAVGKTTIEVAELSTLAIAASDDAIYVLAEQEDAYPRVHIVEPSSGYTDEDVNESFPVTLSQAGAEDVHMGTSYLFVAQGGDDMSKVALSTGTSVQAQENLGGRDFVDLYTLSDSMAYVVDANGGLIQFNAGSNDYYILLDDDDGLVEPSAVAVMEDGESYALLLYETDDETVLVYDVGSATGAPGTEADDSFAAEHIAEFVVCDDYVIGGGNTGVLQVITELPWVTVDAPTSSIVSEGAMMVLTFSSDTAGDYRVLLNGDLDSEGAEIASGAVEADETALVEVEVDDTYEEGINRIWVLVDDGSHEGHGATVLEVDNPPGAVLLAEDDVGFGDKQFTVAFTGLDDEDLSVYALYVSLFEFDPDDYETGGPEFEGRDDLTFPIEIDGTPGEDVIYTVSPLTNDVTYYVAVRAVDEGGLEGTMSDVVAVKPRSTASASELAEEPGGFCGITYAGGAGAALCAFGLLIGRRRSREAFAPALVAVLVVTALASVVAPSAHAASVFDRGWSSSLAMRYGPFEPVDGNIKKVYGDDGHGVFFVEVGESIWGVLEGNIGLGFYQEIGNAVAENDKEASAEHTMLTGLPISVGVNLRLDIMNEQFVVPFAGTGFSYWLWRENWYVNPDVGGESSLIGGKGGRYMNAGISVRLDTLEPVRASVLKIRSGVEDSYLTAEWRRQDIGNDGLVFDGDITTIGLKLSF
jgi:hypothetical protein